ncbi:molybdopterin synthase sulfurylase [Capsaspora owczarzaki ATCC 30864]|uniref:Adenylyltransferase and sulfurtransferase MOCS3 homolog n=1 Tax=Capsaspora owczarzaki (strain ATCC 30864) TaxID=595528 RepID=A0A0D2X4J8_CAPO3|nr:molybdopterin synthase sulfurylase [Capsaspora owczarzaki ATCC 30864]KJE96184.1 molybdopterin synthase sulfurylase [Capsaspora owczarzaki ATCC 30864]|eukprot:XP_004345292.2 molybdopterin synthase sulfurylase [Capsaspora owczarzaki ATCC 30864]
MTASATRAARIHALQDEIGSLKALLAAKEAALAREVALVEQDHEDNQDEVDATAAATERLNKNDVARFSRHLLMEEIGVTGQLKLKHCRILVVGAGGLGSPALLYLAAAGVGTLGVVDYDVVDLNNLQRQVLHSETRIGIPKVTSAAIGIAQINSACQVRTFNCALTRENALDIVQNFDIVLDASDNPATRYLINDACVLLDRPLVSGSALRMEGQLTTYHINGGPCYRCIFPAPPVATTVTNCSDGGVLGAVTGIIGVLQALEAVKIAVGLPAAFAQQLLLFDGTLGKFRSFKLRNRRPDCAVCGDQPTITRDLIDYEAFCGSAACDKTPSLKLLSPDERISCKDAEKLLRAATSTNPLLIDVRPRLQFNICSLPQFINIPYAPPNTQDADFIASVQELLTRRESAGLPTRPEVVLVCRRGNDSQLAARLLKSTLGLDQVVDIAGGLEEWSRCVDPDLPMY